MSARWRTLSVAAQRAGLDFFAVADTRPARSLFLAYGLDTADWGRAITLGLRVPASLFAGVKARHRGQVLAYRYHCQVASDMLDGAANRICRVLADAGHQALPVPAGQRLARDGLVGLASHKAPASLSGEGVIGLSGLFLHRDYGAGVRLATVFTDADLPTGEPAPGSCRECGRCVTACPVGAIAGRRFDPGEGRDQRVDVLKCSQHSEELKRDWGVDMAGTACGLCVAVCPGS